MIYIIIEEWRFKNHSSNPTTRWTWFRCGVEGLPWNLDWADRSGLQRH